MAHEYTMLALMALFFLYAWFPVSVGKKQSYGLKWLASNRDTAPKRELPLWAQRCDRAHNNLRDYFPAFAVAILVLGAQDKFDVTTSYAATTFFVCRVGHYISYGMGNFLGRFLFFATSLIAQTYLLIKIFI